ncbi:MAG: NAD(P)-dependent glycerol-3-phosphate dehydrogenase [Gammaproteobacteria bacterium]|nr:NAD(P)-dependent glycerol-3-phosphate dehydrogenase [Gammaproteobacteria bacterium]
MNSQLPAIAVLGAGSWGTALAILLSSNGAQIRLWSHLQAHADNLQRDHENKEFLPGIPFPGTLHATADLAASLDGVKEVLVAVPSHAFRQVLESARPWIDPSVPLSWATKGLEPESGHLMHHVVSEVLGSQSIAVISGPSFAGEVARGFPTAITIASNDPDHADQLVRYLHSDSFRPYTSDDLIGLEVGGAAKNVMAIAAGIADGLGFGANTRSALITRGLAEIIRFGLALGGKSETLMGLGGLGDLVLTCTDDQSRNRRMGLALARGQTIEQARQEIAQEVEGVMTAREICFEARRLNVDMPITEQTYRVLYEGLSPRQAVQNLQERRHKREVG